jgi:hypothetical protein
MEEYFSIMAQYFSKKEKYFSKMEKYFSKKTCDLQGLNSHPPVARLELIHPTKASDKN